MKEVKPENYIAMVRDKYKNDEEFTRVMGDVVLFLTKNDYQVLVTYEDVGVYRIEYADDPCHTDYSTPRFMCVSCEEQEDLWFQREKEEE